jgi:hypothetical protein
MSSPVHNQPESMDSTIKNYLPILTSFPGLVLYMKVLNNQWWLKVIGRRISIVGDSLLSDFLIVFIPTTEKTFKWKVGLLVYVRI